MSDASPASEEVSIDGYGLQETAFGVGASADGAEAWHRVPDRIDTAIAAAAKEALWPRVSAWLMRLLDYPGFREWKDEVARRHMVFAVLPEVPVEPFTDFSFDAGTLRQHEIVAGYVRLTRAAIDCRSTEHYFRRYPFRGLPIGRDEHLRTCAPAHLRTCAPAQSFTTAGCISSANGSSAYLPGSIG